MSNGSTRTLAAFAVVSAVLFALPAFAAAPPAGQPFPLPTISLGVSPANNPQQVSTALQVLLLMTVLTLAPALLVLVTSFTRIVVVLSLLRQAIGAQQVPPNQVILGLSLFLTFFVMAPVFDKVYSDSLKPYMANEIQQNVAFDRALVPLREFMFKQTREKDLALFVHMSKMARPKNPSEVPTHVLIPAFVISELKTAFEIGFMLFVPFLVLDMIVASVLMSMGMMMLPPVLISLPFKLLLFVLVDGWYLVVGSLVQSFR